MISRFGTVHLAACCLASLLAGCGSDPAAAAAPPGVAADAASAEDVAASDAGGDVAAEAAPPPYTSAIYSDADNWLCLPGKDGDVCHESLDATVLLADGTMTPQPHVFATHPAIDCFYVYPTISGDKTPNSDLIPGPEEITTVKEQAARFTSVCDVYAPVYRQVTLGALVGALSGDAGAADRELAYGDVLDAWKHYLANYNQGRPFVLAGHSQGAGVLTRLVQEEIEGDDALRARLVSALLIGGNLSVPDGKDVGQDFKKVPVCHAPTDTGCAVAYSSFRATAPPPVDSLFGKPRTGPGVAVCANPAALGGGPATLAPYYGTVGGLTSLPGLTGVTTPFVTLPDFVRGECVTKNGFTYLEITLLSSPTDKRPTDTGGDLTPSWGLHLVDMHLAMGNLVDLVAAQATAFKAK